MPRSTVNILLAIAAAICGVPGYFLIGSALDHNIISLGSDMPWPPVIGVITTALIAAAWAAIFRRSIRWTKRRVWSSLGAFLAIALLSFLATYFGRAALGREEVLMFMPMLGIAATLAALALIWRQTPEELRSAYRAPSIPCPACGYNLAGLKQTTCPECGREFTLDQLARPDRDVPAE